MLKTTVGCIEISMHSDGNWTLLKSNPLSFNFTGHDGVDVDLGFDSHCVVAHVNHTIGKKNASQINISIENSTERIIFIDYVQLTLTNYETDKDQDWLVYLDPGMPGWSGVKHLDALDREEEFQLIDDENLKQPYKQTHNFHRSSLHTVLFNTVTEQGSLIGFLSQQKGYNGIDIFPEPGTSNRLGKLNIWQMFGTAIQPGMTISLDPLSIHSSEDPLYLLKEYAEQVRDFHHLCFSEPPIVGMMTWYGYHSAISESIIYSNLPLLQNIFNGYPQSMTKLLLIDHGWSVDANWGYWVQADPDRFPDGLESLSEIVNDAGFDLGLWYTPFCVTENSPNYDDLIPLLAKNTKNELYKNLVSVFGHLPGHSENPWPIYFLDAGLDMVQSKWNTEMRHMAEKWKCKYWKLDFFALLTSENRRTDFSISQLYKKTYQNFRSAIGKNRHLAPCSGDTNIHLGRADSMRIAADIGKAGNWPKTLSNYRHGLSTVAAQWHKNKNFWINDADSIQIGCGCSLNEARARATMVAFSGGHIFVSEDLDTISNDRIEIIRRILPAYPRTAIPVDLFHNVYPESYPHIWQLNTQSTYGTESVLAIFNLSENPYKQEIYPEWFGYPEGLSFSVYEWWQQHWIGKFDSSFIIEIPPADVAILHAGLNLEYPWLVSCSHHHTGTWIIQNLQFDHSLSTLSGEILTKSGLKLSLMGTIPNGWRVPFSMDSHTRENGVGGWTHDLKTTSQKTFFEISFQNGTD